MAMETKAIDFNPQYYYDAYFTRKNLLTHVFYRVKMDKLTFVIVKYKKTPARVLDCACASGLLSYLLANEKFKVSAFDILEDFVLFVKKRILHGHVFQADIMNVKSPINMMPLSAPT